MSEPLYEGMVEGAGLDVTLRAARDRGLLSSLDVHFATRLVRLYEEARPAVLWGVALACHHEAQGHVCADLRRLARDGLFIDDGSNDEVVTALPNGMDLEAWLALLRTSAVVEDRSHAAHGDATSAEGSADDVVANAPLVLDAAGRLYLRRSFADQAALAASVQDRATRPAFEVDESWLSSVLQRTADATSSTRGAKEITSEANADEALRKGLLRPLTLVTGGPGTGKTTLMARLVALVVEQRLASGRPAPRIRLLAPTGKAAAAMSDSFQRQRATLQVADEVKEALPSHAETIHRVVMRQTRTDALGEETCRPLDDDILVVDEASMVDLSLMRQVFEMGRNAERILLLGDPDQLASVDSGAVLGELCEAAQRMAEPSAKPSGKRTRAEGPPSLRDSWVRLEESHRFAAGGAIGRLAEAIRAGDADRVIELLEDPTIPEISRESADSVSTVQARLVDSARALQDAILSSTEPGQKLERLSSHRILCAHRKGPLGVEVLCERLDDAVARIRRTSSRSGWWAGRLVLVTRNAPEQDLWNGDVGLVEETQSGLRALFASADGDVRSISAGRLPAFESAIAMSIHKSQGSEFDSVDLVLGNRASRLMTRELLYTGVTRARERVVIHASDEVLRAAVGRRVVRDSGLVDLLLQAED